MDDGERHRELRRLAFSIAYRMLGSVSDAEDVVQEVFLRLHRAGTTGTRVETPEAYVATATTRAAIDHLRSARVRREAYVGPWLPEPLVGAAAEVDPQERPEMAESLTMAFLVLMESLSPVERAVFLLREVFQYGYEEIAQIVGKSEANCRQIFVRARQRLAADRPRFQTSAQERDELAEAFLSACERGDVDSFVDLLADDVAFFSDGGGKVPAAREPVFGRQRVVPLVRAILTRLRRQGWRLVAARVNAEPGALVVDGDGTVVTAAALEISAGAVRGIRVVANPDKIVHVKLPDG